MSTATVATEFTFYHALMVCRARALHQFMFEARKFWPAAAVMVADGSTTIQDLYGFSHAAYQAETPMVVICSRDTMRSNVDVLEAFFSEVGGDDFVLDEATFLRGRSSKQTKAAWSLRNAFDVAVPMTATPINRTKDELGEVQAWSRNDRDLFQGMRLSTRFDSSDSDQMQYMWDHVLGPTLARHDLKDVRDQLPQVRTEAVVIDLHPDEKALAETAQNGLRALLNDLLSRLEDRSESDEERDQYREEIAALYRRVRAGSKALRVATSDPESLNDSDAALVDVLRASGHVDRAIAAGGTRRTQIVDVTTDLVSEGQAVVIFTEHKSVAKRLLRDLKVKNVRVASIVGGTSIARSQEIQDGFQGGEGGQVGPNAVYDVLILTGVAEDSLNLHRASTIIMFDPPENPEQMTQRIGRAVRMGSKNDYVDVLLPVAYGTFDEQLVERLLAGSAESISVLDLPRGVDAKDTEIGRATTGIVDALDGINVSEESSIIIEHARQLLG